MRISDWSSDVCSSDLVVGQLRHLVEIGKEAHVERRKVVEFQIAVRAADDAAAAVIFGADPRAEALVEKAAVELDEVTIGAAAAARRRSVQQVELGDAGTDTYSVGQLARVVQRHLPAPALLLPSPEHAAAPAAATDAAAPPPGNGRTS